MPDTEPGGNPARRTNSAKVVEPQVRGPRLTEAKIDRALRALGALDGCDLGPDLRASVDRAAGGLYRLATGLDTHVKVHGR